MNVKEYVERLFIGEDALHTSISKVLQERNITPKSISLEVAKTLRLLVKIAGAKKILEVGTLGGFSTINFAKALDGVGSVTSLEIDPELAQFAQSNAETAGVGSQINIRVGHALESLQQLREEQETFDLIFIDADKENYTNYLDAVIKIAQPNALIIADNALWDYRVLDENDQSEATIGIRSFNEKIANDSRLETMLLTIGDGLVIARLK
ncbi:Predicted O-methyltransferase YrrM [Seinonella peptonophila]|uniref:Predicted O-methyltransferase YrrM n=2 Tax=Seinonella peptonophila TaxID=112248 RepID=A0A1M4T585_9BACL|nr:Predicted O-methyltransferase YrrM [Seinonella peptonophila]